VDVDYIDDDEEQGPSPEILRARQVLENGGGLSGCTTLMIRNIPSRYIQRKLLKEIHAAGYYGQYDFFYLPIDPRTRGNRGFAFINLVNTERAEAFYKTFQGNHLRLFISEQALLITPANVQGFEENAIHNISAMVRRKRAPHNRPLFLKPLPEHLCQSLCDFEAGQADHSKPEKDCMSASKTGSAEMKGTAPSRVAQLNNGNGPNGARNKNMAQANFANPIGAGLVQRFCAFCGARKQVVHNFCPYCGCKSIESM